MADERSRALQAVEKQLRESKESAKSLKDELLKIDDALKSLKDQAEKVKFDLGDINPKTIKDIDAINKKQKKGIDLAIKIERLNAQKERTQALANKREAQNIILQDRINKLSEKNAKAKQKEANAYNRLNKLTKEARDRARELAVQYGENDKRTQVAITRYEQLDNKLKEVNRTTSNGRRSFSELVDSNEKLSDSFAKSRTRLIGFIGLITGAISSLRGLFNISNEQDQINKRLTASFQLKGQALEDTRKKVQFLSQAYKKDLNEVIDTATVLTNEFKISQEEAFDLIGKGFEKGADVRGEFLEQLKEYSTQFVNVGLTAEEAIAVITQSENKGVFSDKGVDAIKEAGIRLTELPKSTSEALKAIGLSGEEIQRQITTGQKTVFEVTQEISREIAKLPPNATEVGQVLADVFGGAGEDAKGFVLELGNVSTELDELEDTTTEYEKAQQKVINQLIEYKEEIAQRTIPILKFLAENFRSIIAIVLRAIRIYAIFKISNSRLGKSVGVLGKEFIKSGGNIRKFVKNLKNAASGSKSAGVALRGMGKALKSISFTVAIDLAIQLATSLYDIASGAKAARIEQQLLDSANKSAQKNLDKIDEKIRKNFEGRIRDLDVELRTKKANAIEAGATAKELAKLEKDLDVERAERTKEIAETARKENVETENAKRRALRDTERLENLLTDLVRKRNNGTGLERISALRLLNAELEKAGVSTKGLSNDFKDVNKTINTVDNRLFKRSNRLKTELDVLRDSRIELSKQVEEYGLQLRETVNTEEDYSVSIEDNTDKIKKNNSELEKQLKLLTDVELALKEQNKIATENNSKQSEEELQQELDLVDKRLTERSTKITDAQRLEQISSKESNEQTLIAEIDSLLERRKILIAYGKDVTEIDNELANKRLALVDQISSYEELALQNQIDKEREALLERAEMREKWIQTGQNLLDEYYDRQIENQKELADANRRLSDQLSAEAAAGTIEAKDSIAEQKRLEEQALADKARLEREKQLLEKATSIILAFNNALSDPDNSVSDALLIAGTSSTALDFLVSSLTGFFHGTEDTGTGGGLKDKHGAITGYTHENERVLTKNDNLSLLERGLSNEQVAKYAIAYDDMQRAPLNYAGLIMQHAIVADPIYLERNRNIELERKVDQLTNSVSDFKKAVLNRPIPNSRIGEMFSSFMTFIDDDGKGNSKEYMVTKNPREKFGSTGSNKVNR